MLTRWRYWLDFIWPTPVIVAAFLIDCRSWIWLLVFVGGFLLWTFTEYWVHRSLLHRFFWHGTHERHHLLPAEYVEALWWSTPLLFVLFYLAMPTALFAGFTAGYLWFQVMHHWLHHIDLRERTWLHRYAIWHNRHHKVPSCNYGITTPMWDMLFRTSR